MAGALYHSVGAWKPDVQVDRGDMVTPGRISHVFFFPQKSYQKLEGKEPRWAVRTLWGKFADFRRTKEHKESLEPEGAQED